MLPTVDRIGEKLGFAAVPNFEAQEAAVEAAFADMAIGLRLFNGDEAGLGDEAHFIAARQTLEDDGDGAADGDIVTKQRCARQRLGGNIVGGKADDVVTGAHGGEDGGDRPAVGGEAIGRPAVTTAVREGMGLLLRPTGSLSGATRREWAALAGGPASALNKDSP